MHYSSLCSKILIKKGNIWTNRPVHGLLACYKRSYRIFLKLIFNPEMVLADGWTKIETPQPWCQKEEDTTIQREPFPPPPYLSWRKPHSRPREPPDHSSPSIIPHVSIVSWQFPRLEAFQNTCLGSGDHYPGLIIIFWFFPFVYRSIKVWF